MSDDKFRGGICGYDNGAPDRDDSVVAGVTVRRPPNYPEPKMIITASQRKSLEELLNAGSFLPGEEDILSAPHAHTSASEAAEHYAARDAVNTETSAFEAAFDLGVRGEIITSTVQHRKSSPVENQTSITAWATEQFGGRGPLTTWMRCNNEFAELGTILNSFINAEGWDDSEIFRKAAIEEVADVAIILMQVMERLGGNFHDAIDDKMQINRARKWKKLDNGRHQHDDGGES